MKPFLSLLIIIIILTSCKTKEVGITCTEKKTPIDTSEVYYVTETMAKYKNGMIDIMHFVQANFIYPKSQETLQTKAAVKFVINRQGYVSDAVINNKTNDKYTLFDKEMLRVINSMPQWTPAKQEGIIVKQIVILPIQLEIK